MPRAILANIFFVSHILLLFCRIWETWKIFSILQPPPCDNKQIFHVFFGNTRNYSPEVINIQRRAVELNILFPRVNNFDIKQKKGSNICFIICHQHQTRSGKIKANKTQQIPVKTQVFFESFFVKTELQHI